MKLSIVLLGIVSLAWFGQVNSICFDLTKQYFECYLLNMTFVDEGWKQFYIPDPDTPDNFLDDSLYNWFLSGYNAEDALNILRAINQEISGCDSEICKCVKQRRSASFYNNDDTYAVYFNDDANFADVSDIIRSLDDALADDRVSVEELQEYFGFGYGENLTSLTEFCGKAEYAGIRAFVYKTYYECIKYDYSIFKTCDYYMKVDSENREALLEYNDEVKRRYLECETLTIRDCIPEQQVFRTLTSWAESYERIDTNGQGLKDFVAGLIDGGNSIPLDDLYDTVYVTFYSDVAYYKAFNTDFSSANLSSIGNVISLISSDKLNLGIEVQPDESQDGQPIITKVIVNANDGNEITEFIFDDSSDDDSFQNQTISNSNGDNILQIVFHASEYNKYFEIYDFNSESIITVSISYLNILSPTSLFQNAEGFLISGVEQQESPQDEEPSGDDEAKFQCKEICKKISERMSLYSSSKHVDMENARCMESC